MSSFPFSLVADADEAEAYEVLGMATRLCFDLGLNIDCSGLGLPEKEVQIRSMVLWACVTHDRQGDPSSTFLAAHVLTSSATGPCFSTVPLALRNLIFGYREYRAQLIL